MPLLTLTTWPALSDAGERLAIARELTDHTARLLGKQLPLTAVAVMPAPLGWSLGGEPIDPAAPSAGPMRTFALEIRITAGTNTAAQKAAWIAAAWDTLRHALPGTPAEASYVSIVEIAATDWGYGGRTQASRRP
jgi:4-oxalocrotonate tautomerase